MKANQIIPYIPWEIRLNVSLIKLRHVPPIKINYMSFNLFKSPINRGTHQFHGGHSKIFSRKFWSYARINLQSLALQETSSKLSDSSPKVLKKFYIQIFEYEEHSKNAHLDHSSRPRSSTRIKLPFLHKIQEPKPSQLFLIQALSLE